MPRFESIDFYQNKLKIKLFLQIQIFLVLGAPLPDPRNNHSPIADFWLRA